MDDKLIRVNDVMAMLGIAKSTVWLWVKQGKIPKPIKLSRKVSVWRESDMLDYIASL